MKVYKCCIYGKTKVALFSGIKVVNIPIIQPWSYVKELKTRNQLLTFGESCIRMEFSKLTFIKLLSDQINCTVYISPIPCTTMKYRHVMLILNKRKMLICFSKFSCQVLIWHVQKIMLWVNDAKCGIILKRFISRIELRRFLRSKKKCKQNFLIFFLFLFSFLNISPTVKKMNPIFPKFANKIWFLTPYCKTIESEQRNYFYSVILKIKNHSHASTLSHSFINIQFITI